MTKTRQIKIDNFVSDRALHTKLPLNQIFVFLHGVIKQGAFPVGTHVIFEGKEWKVTNIESMQTLTDPPIPGGDKLILEEIENQEDIVDGVFYLLVDYDNHTDPVYHLFTDRGLAITEAKECAEQYKKGYGDMLNYESDAWEFNAYGEDRWEVKVVKLECGR